MSLSEFTLIEKFFDVKSSPAYPAALGIGDDCALVDVPAGQQLAISSDTLVEGVHFLADSDATSLGHKALAVNLSDLAAMGATPAWLTLALTLPSAKEKWLAGFSAGFLNLASNHAVQLIGGDTTRGPLSITVTAMGLLAKGAALKRSGAQVGDLIFVSGVIGSAGLGLLLAQQNGIDQNNEDLLHYLRPLPRLDVAKIIAHYASSCIDVSDGLAADLNHILRASHVGATLEHVRLPMSAGVKQYLEHSEDWRWPYSTGDDYQLCFTCPAVKEAALLQALQGLDVTRIGVVEQELGLRLALDNAEISSLDQGYQHFK